MPKFEQIERQNAVNLAIFPTTTTKSATNCRTSSPKSIILSFKDDHTQKKTQKPTTTTNVLTYEEMNALSMSIGDLMATDGRMDSGMAIQS
jgi:hypothetical protein